MEVTDDDRIAQIEWVKSRNPRGVVNEGADWLAAAMEKAREMGCNPGGSVQGEHIGYDRLPPDAPRNKLMQEAELRERNLI